MMPLGFKAETNIVGVFVRCKKYFIKYGYNFQIITMLSMQYIYIYVVTNFFRMSLRRLKGRNLLLY